MKTIYGCCVAALLSATSPAHAEVATVQATASVNPADSGTGLAEIVVTARRREEELQKVPVAVTVIGAQELARRQLLSLDEIIRLSPSVSFKEGLSDTFQPRIFFRGVGTDAVILSLSPTIGTYIDDVYYGTTLVTGGANLQDVQNVQVLKGPQGTLYGRNSTGGAVKVTTNPPNYNGTSGSITAGYGNYNQVQVSGFFNAPIVADKLALRISGQRVSRDGYGYDRANNSDLLDMHSWALRGALRANPTDKLEIIVRGDYLHSTSGGVIMNLTEVTPNFVSSPTSISLGTLSIGLQSGILTANDKLIALGAAAPGTPADLAAYQARANAANALFRSEIDPKAYSVAYGHKQSGLLGVWGSSVTARYDLTDDLAIQSISAYHKTKKLIDSNQDGTAYGLIFGRANNVHLAETSEELQLTGKALNQRLSFTAGGFYYHSVGHDNDFDSNTAPLALANPLTRYSLITRNSFAGYGQANYAITDTVHLTAGLRYTDETYRLNSNTVKAGVCQIAVVSRINGACEAEFKTSYTNTSYTVGADWNVTSDALLYVTRSTGFKAGGVNQMGGLAGGFLPFAPEKVTSDELGAKTKWLDGRLIANLAIYKTDYKDLQRNANRVDPATNQLSVVVSNAASAHVRGAELEVSARPTRSLVLQAGGAYTDPKYGVYTSNGVDLSHNKFAGAAKWQGTASAVYTMDMRWGSIDAGVDYDYQSSVQFTPDSFTAFSGNYTTQKGYGLWNASLGVDLPSRSLRLSAYVKNIAQKRYISSAIDLSGPASFGYVASTNGLPRTYGVSIRKDF